MATENIVAEVVIETQAVQTVAEYVEHEREIGQGEEQAMRGRWAFGCSLLLERAANGGKQLPHGRLDEICDAVGRSRAEIGFRMKFAERYDTEEKVSNALGTYGTWHEIILAGLTDKPHVSHNSGDNEWYTPAEYIMAARQWMGEIELDPASSDIANKAIRAKRYFTAQDDGLERDWSGRVWMNPPYAGDLIGQFVDKLCEHVDNEDVPQATVLVNNATDTAWFHELAARATAICFPSGRVGFENADGRQAKPLQGQALLCIGGNRRDAASIFKQFGFVVSVL